MQLNATDVVPNVVQNMVYLQLYLTSSLTDDVQYKVTPGHRIDYRNYSHIHLIPNVFSCLLIDILHYVTIDSL